MKNKIITAGFLIVPLSVFASDKPSMSALWIELLLLIVLLVVLKLSKFTNQQKLILFFSYVFSGIITKTIWFPVSLFIILFYVFNQNTNDDDFT